MIDECWRPVIGYEDSYEVSTLGRVRSTDRIVIQSNGHVLHLKSRVLRHGKTQKGHHFVVLSRGGIQTNHRVHLLVLGSFVGPRPGGMHGLHWDDNKSDNSLPNLRYGSPSENMRDMVRNGLCPKSNQTYCIHGHEFTADNTAWSGPVARRYRRCRKCARARRRYFRQLARSRTLGLPAPILVFPPPDKDADWSDFTDG